MNETMLKSAFNERFLSLNPENQLTGPFAALSGQKHLAQNDPGRGD
jgi:hypothetical protein